MDPMGLLRLLASKRFKQLTGVSMLLRAGRQFLSGDRRTAALLVGAGALAFRSTWAGILAELGIRAYRRRRNWQENVDPDHQPG
jgi:hypothetical protein